MVIFNDCGVITERESAVYVFAPGGIDSTWGLAATSLLGKIFSAYLRSIEMLDKALEEELPASVRVSMCLNVNRIA